MIGVVQESVLAHAPYTRICHVLLVEEIVFPEDNWPLLAYLGDGGLLGGGTTIAVIRLLLDLEGSFPAGILEDRRLLSQLELLLAVRFLKRFVGRPVGVEGLLSVVEKAEVLLPRLLPFVAGALVCVNCCWLLIWRITDLVVGTSVVVCYIHYSAEIQDRFLPRICYSPLGQGHSAPLGRRLL